MKSSKLILAATLLGGLLSAQAVAATVIHVPKKAPAPLIEAPVPSVVVNPTGLPRRAEGSIVKVSMTIDENGQPHDVKIVSPNDSALSRSLVPAVSQWQFTPARKNGVAVSTKVVMPVHLIDGDKT